MYQDQAIRALKLTNVQGDEILRFIGLTAKNVPTDANPALCLGDRYTFTGTDRETKLMPCLLVGNRTTQCADDFIGVLAQRLANPVWLTTDSGAAYPAVVAKHIGKNVDYAVIQKSDAASPAFK